MELLSNSAAKSGSLKMNVSANNLTKDSDSSGSNSEPRLPLPSNDELSNNLFISSFLNALPRWDYLPEVIPRNEPPQSHDLLFPSLLDPFGQSKIIPNTFASNPTTSQSADLYGAIGTLNHFGQITPSTSPHTNTSSSTSSSHSTHNCGRCDVHAISRCLDCNDVLCDDCVAVHKSNTFTKDHYIIGMGIGLNAIGSGPYNPPVETNSEMHCESHGEILRYLDESCKKIVCQECTLREHKDHICVPVGSITENAREKLTAVLESGKLGIKYIKSSIDRAVTYSQSVERDAMETSSRVRKAMRHFIMAAEDRERNLVEQIDKYRQQKLTSLSDQMTGLRSALAGLAQVSDKLSKAIDSCNNMSSIDIALALTNAESQIEKFAMMYKNLQPKEEFISFVPPNFELLQDIRMQGEIVMNVKNGSGSSVSSNSTNPSPLLHASSSQSNLLASGTSSSTSSGGITRRPIVRNATNTQPAAQPRPAAWDTSKPTMAAVLRQSNQTSTVVGQCIPGSNAHISAKPALGPSTTFGFDGQEDGHVSRPWGLCVDKDNNVIVADRRNNRVQVFYPDGTFKFKFGSKGTGNGQFDLPAGICTDPQNRIVVVDKDNHRIQIFTSMGVFVLKFGSFGKECGQFQYPWDVAVNTKGEILVTDSRNHRIQLFNPDGHFISRFSFDGVNHSRQLRGLTTPRGCCFNPQGDIIISDFENHRLILIDSCMTKVMALKGHEGTNLHEFCRPSGICCDDDGRVVVADSKNQRVLIFSPSLEFLWAVDIRPSSHNILTANMDEKDRPSDVALLTDGRLVVMVETSPDCRDQCSPHKTFIQIY